MKKEAQEEADSSVVVLIECFSRCHRSCLEITTKLDSCEDAIKESIAIAAEAWLKHINDQALNEEEADSSIEVLMEDSTICAKIITKLDTGEDEIKESEAIEAEEHQKQYEENPHEIPVDKLHLFIETAKVKEHYFHDLFLEVKEVFTYLNSPDTDERKAEELEELTDEPEKLTNELVSFLRENCFKILNQVLTIFRKFETDLISVDYLKGLIDLIPQIPQDYQSSSNEDLFAQNICVNLYMLYMDTKNIEFQNIIKYIVLNNTAFLDTNFSIYPPLLTYADCVTPLPDTEEFDPKKSFASIQNLNHEALKEVIQTAEAAEESKSSGIPSSMFQPPITEEDLNTSIDNNPEI